MYRSQNKSLANISLAACLLVLILDLVILSVQDTNAMEPGDVVDCSPAHNISQSLGFSSADPFIVANPDGRVHLFWAERTIGQSGGVPNVPDTLLYSEWDGGRWSLPTDIFISPPERFNKFVGGVRGLLADDGELHLVWLGPDNLFFYSSVHSTLANQPGAWRKPRQMANDQSGTQYSVDIAYSAPQTLHIIYARGTATTNTNRAVTYLRSEDNGASWSEPVDIFIIPHLDRGASNIRLHVDAPSKVYASWTEWDSTGNGQAVYFARSLDGGEHWQEPVVLDRRRGEEYERDWTTLAVLGEDQLVAFWEGGWRAYRQAQYSEDGGETWSPPVDTLDWLIADNGFAEFARDSADRLHLFVFQRVREGNTDKGEGEGLWHTFWEGERRWREPELVGAPTPANFVTIAISGGNELFAAWFDYTTLEVRVINCIIEGAPSVPPAPWPELSPSVVGVSGEAEEPEDIVALTPTAAVVTQPVSPGPESEQPVSGASLPGIALIGGILPTVLVLIIVLIVILLRGHTKRRSHQR